MKAVCLLGALLAGAHATAVPRRVRVKGQKFVVAATGEEIILSGPNVVVKGPPYLPSVSGTTHCRDYVNSTCSATGTCETCYTFNKADTDLIKSQGRNFIRLGVAWAGAQPRDEDKLDPDFLERLHAILNLTDREGIHVMLDNHGDMVGSAGCGNGAPMWFQKKAVPTLIGKPLKTGFPFELVSQLQVEKVGGYDKCGDNATKWAAYAGDPNYNLLNECCQAMNSPNPAGLGWTTISQGTMNYMLLPGAGRDDFVRYWRLMAEEIKQHPSAFAIEPSNEPMSIDRRAMYDTWRAVTEAVTPIIPDVSVAVADTGEGPVLPEWVTTILDVIPLPYLAPTGDTVKWMRESENLFYAFHWYGNPKDPDDAVKNALGNGVDWDMPTFSTEFFSCAGWTSAAKANVSHSYWHYSCYCNTGADFGNRKVPEDTFGACILGWGGGSPDRCM
eukprot:Hpha_TRINITY_DN3549_c0_g1::TRINITY_DN3549_c0_g1_i1::g.25735::m.25735